MPTPEELARHRIDALLAKCGWVVQTKSQINLAAAAGIALCELTFKTGEPDYTLFVDGKAIGTIEAKPVGATLTGVEEQSTKYVSGIPFRLAAWKSPLPFSYESTGEETYFTNRLDPEPRSRAVFAFHRPETLRTWVQEEKQLAQRLREFPPLQNGQLWPAQIEAIKNLEKSPLLNSAFLLLPSFPLTSILMLLPYGLLRRVLRNLRWTFSCA
jgi:type I restriction enzyme, R subunit